MLKLRHLCLQQMDECPPELKDDLKWDVEMELKNASKKIERLEDSIMFLKKQRYKQFEFVPHKTKRRIFMLGEEIGNTLFDDWQPEDHDEEVWREYFFCLYEFMITEHTYPDITNIKSLSGDCVRVYEQLKKPRARQSQMAHIMDYKFVELYTLYKSLKYPEDIVESANIFLNKKLGLTEQIRKKYVKLDHALTQMGVYTELLSSSLCSRR